METSSPYRKAPMQHVFKLSEAEVKSAIRRFAQERTCDQIPDDAQVKLNVWVFSAEKGSYEVTADVVGPWEDQS